MLLTVIQVQYFTRQHSPPINVVDSVVDDSGRRSAKYVHSFDSALLDSTAGWIASSSDLVRLFEALSAAEASPPSAAAHLLAPSSVRAMLERRAPATAADDRSKVWYGLGLVVEDGGRTFWHSGTLDGSTSMVVRDANVGLTWAALVNRRLEPNNDLWDFMRYAVTHVFGAVSPTTPPLQPPTSSYLSPLSSSAAAAAGADPSWLQQHDSSVTDHNDALRPEPEVESGDSEKSTMRQTVDSVSRDGRTAVKLMIPSYRVSDTVSTVASAGYRPAWIDAVDYHDRIFFNIIWTRNDDEVRSSAPIVIITR